MEKEGYLEVLERVIDPDTMLAGMPGDKIWLLIGELEEIADDYEREMAITYLSCNHSEVKHLCTTYLRGKTDEFILEKLSCVKDAMQRELKRRKRERAAGQSP